MPCVKVKKKGFVCMSNIEFRCPVCDKLYLDENDKFLKRINNNKNWVTKINCSCGKKIKLSYDYTGEFVIE